MGRQQVLSKLNKTKAYLESLNEDKKKTEERKAWRQEVPDEPGPGEDPVLVQVSQVSLVIIKRRFHSCEKIISVYYWVG